jgi:hypothetical protein
MGDLEWFPRVAQQQLAQHSSWAGPVLASFYLKKRYQGRTTPLIGLSFPETSHHEGFPAMTRSAQITEIHDGLR